MYDDKTGLRLTPDRRSGLIFSVASQHHRSGRFYALCGICGDVREISEAKAKGPGFDATCEACYEEVFCASDMAEGRLAEQEYRDMMLR